MSVAFFDLDRTLISRNSGSMWVRAQLREGRISLSAAARALVWLTRYHLGRSGLDGAVLDAIRTLEGQPEADLRQRTGAFYDAEVRGLYRPGALAALNEHRAQGHTLALLTTSSLYMAERVGEALGIHSLLCSRFEVDAQGHFTGRPDGALCFGEGKLHHAQALADSLKVSLGDCAFYTDSVTDSPVLEVVGRPVAVNPDPRLRRLAARKGWAIVDWGEPERGG
ncbi:MAG: HAD-IB family hydrolase [Deltaproteobacteria bacterium]|nr:HAD-IB family hydrolase [Deltaproteobacteria bacterium]MBK9649427.1 HAD-IB family hydrolase [Deltaproteobacteria bacterium]